MPDVLNEASVDLGVIAPTLLRVVGVTADLLGRPLQAVNQVKESLYV